MKLGMIGLGKMGANMTQRLIEDGHEVVAFDMSAENVSLAVDKGAIGSSSLSDLIDKLDNRKVVWVMVPSGDVTEKVIVEVASQLAEGDIIIDGGNSFYKDSVRRHGELATRGINFIDAGTSGGVWGLEVGYCLMVGGDEEPVAHISPALKTLAPPNGYRRVGGAGAGHFVKMVHNGIEYGMMQSYAEGFEILGASNFKIDLRDVAELWGQGSVVRSWLLELLERAFADDPGLDKITGFVNDSGEGRWTVKEAIDLDVPALNLTHALMTRFRSRQDNSFSDRVLAALRNQFGGHAVKSAEPVAK
ncbi:MAG: phosphogluconate dehydrogenase (NAD(+)-dependent, decarboxylating) [Candidatus Zixiibacteriota bacterium]